MFETFGYPEYSSHGEKILTTRNGKFCNMQMDIRVYQLNAGEEKVVYYDSDEAAILLLNGKITLQWEASEAEVERNDLFTEGAHCLHIKRQTEVRIQASAASELLIQRTENPASFASRLYGFTDYRDSVVGEGMCEDRAVRTVRTIFDYSNAPYSNMVLGEVISRQGSWSSYIPHYHPQPEVYFYKFDRPQGFGACFIGEDVFKITDGSFCAIPGGLTHPQVTAPGYQMYTCWMIRHLDNEPWTERIDDKAHLWITEDNR